MSTRTYYQTSTSPIYKEKDFPESMKDAINSFATKDYSNKADYPAYVDFARGNALPTTIDMSYRKASKIFNLKSTRYKVVEGIPFIRSFIKYLRDYKGFTATVLYAEVSKLSHSFDMRKQLVDNHGWKTSTNTLAYLSNQVGVPVFLKDAYPIYAVDYVNNFITSNFANKRKLYTFMRGWGSVQRETSFPLGEFTISPLKAGISRVFTGDTAMKSGQTFDRAKNDNAQDTGYQIPDYTGNSWFTAIVNYTNQNPYNPTYTFSPQPYTRTQATSVAHCIATYRITTIGGKADGTVKAGSTLIKTSSSTTNGVVTKLDDYEYVFEFEFADSRRFSTLTNDEELYGFLGKDEDDRKITDPIYYHVAYINTKTGNKEYMRFNQNLSDIKDLIPYLNNNVGIGDTWPMIPIYSDFKRADRNATKFAKYKKMVKPIGIELPTFIDEYEKGISDDAKGKIRDAYIYFGFPVNSRQAYLVEYLCKYAELVVPIQLSVDFTAAISGKALMDIDYINSNEYEDPDSSEYEWENKNSNGMPDAKPADWTRMDSSVADYSQFQDLLFVSTKILPAPYNVGDGRSKIAGAAILGWGGNWGFVARHITHVSVSRVQAKLPTKTRTRNYTFGASYFHYSLGSGGDHSMPKTTESKLRIQFVEHCFKISDTEYIKAVYVVRNLSNDTATIGWNRIDNQATIMLDYAMRNQLSFQNKEKVYAASMRVLTQVEYSVKKSFWDRFSFLIMAAVIIVISVVTVGTGTAPAVSATTGVIASAGVAGVYVAVTALSAMAFFTNVVLALAFMTIATVAKNPYVKIIATVLQMVMTFYSAGTAGGNGFQMSKAINYMKANIIPFISQMGNIYTSVVQAELAKLTHKIDEVNATWKDKLEDINTKLDALARYTPQRFDLDTPLNSIELGFISLGESPSDFIERTIQPNPGIALIDYIGNTVSIATQLPTLEDSLKTF